ncbi:MAG: carbonate dehydratase [Parachlamydiales bacterium]|nr:carbonate dehydratase [Parachlamydiales bacterium]
MKELNRLFENNKKWVLEKTRENPDFYTSLSNSQDPQYLWIGCSDSRVPANQIVGLEAGELFVHRNIGNLFVHSDINCLSVLDYAVNVLKVKHVILCGHYECGAVKAAMEKPGKGIVDHWLCHIRDLFLQHKDELFSIENLKKRQHRLVELNVVQQVYNICHTPIVQNAWLMQRPLCVHGWIYDLHTGFLKDLNLCFSSASQVENLYHV